MVKFRRSEIKIMFGCGKLTSMAVMYLNHLCVWLQCITVGKTRMILIYFTAVELIYCALRFHSLSFIQHPRNIVFKNGKILPAYQIDFKQLLPFKGWDGGYTYCLLVLLNIWFIALGLANKGRKILVYPSNLSLTRMVEKMTLIH